MNAIANVLSHGTTNGVSNGKQRLLANEDDDGIEMAVLIQSDGLAEKENHDHIVEESQTAADDGYFATSSLKAKVHVENEDEIIIKLHNIHKTYLLGVEGVPALRGVSLTIKRGEFVCLYGTSGGGKTSLLNLIGTIDKPTKGELHLCDTRITHRTTDQLLSELRLHHIGFVFQTFNLLSGLTALENVELPMVLAGEKNAEQRRTKAIELLTRVGMEKRLDHLPSQLSGGEQQRVTIARAIANDPELLLLDEPTGDLDSINTAIVLKLLLDLNKEGISLLMVTHDVGLKYFADRVIWLRDGKIHRVEVVPEEKKREQIQKLEEDLEQMQRKKKSSSSLSQANRLNEEHEGSELIANEKPTFSNTQVRQPNFYATYNFAKKQHPPNTQR
eukprot:TRINITY_DN7153_c0_g1_i1.p1 TRINITY_DN7153_c0_g1~~TRINITY_DN7153_c0_g1_i1.p1  ORF type:complete len:388 (+),score=83.91 TRINITY_DN7153_c0_g1_i1:1521-2684(+)